MSVQADLTDALSDGVPFVGIMIFWIVVTTVVYMSFTAVWPNIPDAEPWIYLGVYLLPIIGYLGHTAQQSRKLS